MSTVLSACSTEELQSDSQVHTVPIGRALPGYVQRVCGASCDPAAASVLTVRSESYCSVARLSWTGYLGRPELDWPLLCWTCLCCPPLHCTVRATLVLCSTLCRG